MASQLEKDSNGSLRGGNLRPEIIKIKKGHNFRDTGSEESKAHIAWLKDSIKAEGVKNPITVSLSDGDYYLEAGECRLRAAQQARKEGWDGYIPCFLVKGDEPTILAKSLIDNTGLPPTLLEVGIAVERLVNFNWPMERIAKCIPPSLADSPEKALRVAKKALALQQAPVAVKQAVKEGVDGVKISPAKAIAAARKSPLTAADSLKEAAAKAKAEGKTEIKREKGPGKATKARQQAQASIDDLLAIGDELASMVLDENVAITTVQAQARVWQRKRSKA
jgi:ParB-like chromosome segregation protein Spo0J